jgi:hypothetical protein
VDVKSVVVGSGVRYIQCLFIRSEDFCMLLDTHIHDVVRTHGPLRHGKMLSTPVNASEHTKEEC